MDSVVALVEDGRIFCSGAAIRTRRGPMVLTAAHCVDGVDFVLLAQRGWYRGRNEGVSNAVGARVQNVDEDLDLALLTLPDALGVRPLDVGAQPLQGDPVICAGHPSGIGWLANYGHVSSIQPNESWYMVDCGLAPGMSGGPVLDANGRVVGVNQWVATSLRWGLYTVLGGVARADVVRNFVNQGD
jgi:S1-C subfamily serine protease